MLKNSDSHAALKLAICMHIQFDRPRQLMQSVYYNSGQFSLRIASFAPMIGWKPLKCTPGMLHSSCILHNPILYSFKFQVRESDSIHRIFP